jgi:hypothetical protein
MHSQCMWQVASDTVGYGLPPTEPLETVDAESSETVDAKSLSLGGGRSGQSTDDSSPIHGDSCGARRVSWHLITVVAVQCVPLYM